MLKSPLPRGHVRSTALRTRDDEPPAAGPAQLLEVRPQEWILALARPLVDLVHMVQVINVPVSPEDCVVLSLKTRIRNKLWSISLSHPHPAITPCVPQMTEEFGGITYESSSFKANREAYPRHFRVLIIFRGATDEPHR